MTNIDAQILLHQQAINQLVITKEAKISVGKAKDQVASRWLLWIARKRNQRHQELLDLANKQYEECVSMYTRTMMDLLRLETEEANSIINVLNPDQ